MSCHLHITALGKLSVKPTIVTPGDSISTLLGMLIGCPTGGFVLMPTGEQWPLPNRFRMDLVGPTVRHTFIGSRDAFEETYLPYLIKKTWSTSTKKVASALFSAATVGSVEDYDEDSCPCCGSTLSMSPVVGGSDTVIHCEKCELKPCPNCGGKVSVTFADTGNMIGLAQCLGHIQTETAHSGCVMSVTVP